MRPDLTIDSAGTADWHRDKPPHAMAVAAGAARGFDLSSLRARGIERQDFETFDLILAMDRQNLDELHGMRPKGAAATVGLLMDYVPERQGDDIADPYYTGDFAGSLDLIEAACRGLADALPRI